MNVARLQFLTTKNRQESVQKSDKTTEFSDVMKSFDAVTKNNRENVKSEPKKKNQEDLDIDEKVHLKQKEIPVTDVSLQSVSEEQTEEQMMESIATILDVTMEELKELLCQLGFAMADLLNPDCMTKLLLTANQSTDIQEVLTNETLSSQLFELNQLSKQWEQPLDTEGKNVVNDSEGLDKNSDVREFSSEHTLDGPHETVEETEGQKLEVVVERNEQSNESQQSFQQNDYNLNSFVNQLQQASNEMKTESFDSNVEMSTIVDQIVEQIKVKLGDNVTSMELMLTPEHLGHVNLMIVSKDGVMTAQFYAETEVAKEALESQMQLLKQNFEDQGLKVNEVEVMVSSNPFNSQSGEFSEQGFQQSSEKKKQRQRVQKQELFDPDSMAEKKEPLLQDTSTMDITA